VHALEQQTMMYRVSVIICVVACTLLIFAGAGPDAAVAADSNNSSKQNNAGSDSKENQSLKIEYTPFYPDRMYVSASHEQNKLEKKWGQRWQWPLKTFPNDYRMDWMSDLGDSYGLVYVPGETVQLRIEGDSPQGRVDRIKATNVLDDSTLPVKRGTVSQELAAINAKKSDYIFQDKALKKRGIACDIYKTRGGGAQQGKRVGEKIVNKISFPESRIARSHAAPPMLPTRISSARISERSAGRTMVNRTMHPSPPTISVEHFIGTPHSLWRTTTEWQRRLRDRNRWTNWC